MHSIMHDWLQLSGQSNGWYCKMQKTIDMALRSLAGRSACTVIQLDKTAPRELITLNADMSFPAASLAKLPILVEVARQVETGTLSWETRYKVSQAASVSNTGVLADLLPDLQPTLHDLAHLMITISDNTAANMLLDLVGMQAVNTTMQQLGLTSTWLERRFIDFAARKAGRDNWTTAGDMALLLSYLSTGMLPDHERLLSMLLSQNDRTMLPAYWGEEVPFAHKTGELPGILHNAGILYPPDMSDTPFIIVVLTSEMADEPLTRYALARLGRMIYDNIKQQAMTA
jgi:beta-lactamase class A